MFGLTEHMVALRLLGGASRKMCLWRPFSVDRRRPCHELCYGEHPQSRFRVSWFQSWRRPRQTHDAWLPKAS